MSSSVRLNAPSEKNSWPSASTLESSRICSSGASTPASTAGGSQSPGSAGHRLRIAYESPSTVRLKYHQSPWRTGTDRSVSRVRALISPKIVSRRPARCTVRASVWAFSASRRATTSGSSTSRIHS